MRRLRYVEFLAQILSRTAAAVILLALVAPVIAATIRDDFNDDWPYDATGIVPPGGIWTDGYNLGAGGPHDSNISAPGQLTTGLYDVGWESNTTNGPMQYVSWDSSVGFQAKVKISSQTQGFWSLSGLIVRSPKPLGTGDESYVTIASFRPDPAPTDPESWQMTAPRDPDHAPGGTPYDENEIGGGGLTEAQVSYLMVSHVPGGPFVGRTSADGINWLGRGTRDNPDLQSGMVEIGLFSGALERDFGNVEPGAVTTWDWFEINMIPEPASLGLALVAVVMGGTVIRRRRR